jgi:two-component system response regulator AtoC
VPKHHQRPKVEPTVFHGIVTVSKKMTDFIRHLEKAAKSEANILIRGETGTGKELVARAIHNLSPRSKGPFQALNCATLTSELMQSELFGHVKGSFTGAIADRKGLFEAAHNGTLFLDEIAELPQDLQPRLLRVLQERQFSPVGSFKLVRANIRLVSATHRSLRRLVDDGGFRADLMYRVRVVPLFLPRLAERVRDIEILSWLFIDEFNRRRQRVVTAIDSEALAALLKYPWPGNIRELRNNIEYAFVMGDGEVLTLKELTPEVQGIPAPLHSSREGFSIRKQEIDTIMAALRETGNRKAEAAEKLGFSRAKLWRKIREYDLK